MALKTMDKLNRHCDFYNRFGSPKSRMSCGMESALMITARHLRTQASLCPPYTSGTEVQRKFKTCEFANLTAKYIRFRHEHGGEAARLASVFAMRIFSKGRTSRRASSVSWEIHRVHCSHCAQNTKAFNKSILHNLL